MSYPHQNPYQQDNIHGGQPHVPGHNRGNSSTNSRSLQPPVQGVNNPQGSRSLSGSRRPAPGQAPTFDTYGAGQNREHPQAGVPFVPSTQSSQYIGPQGGQIHSPSFPEQPYQSVDLYNQPPAGQPQHILSPHVRNHPSQPQQPSVPQNTVPAQYSQYQRDPSPRNHQQQWPSTPQYPQQQQQQQPSSQRYPQQQQSLPVQPQTPYSAPSVNAAASFRPNVPGELHEMPGDVTRQSRSIHRDTSPPCRYPNCHRSAARDDETNELTEYCSLDHMRDDLRRGVPPCPACNKCPKRIDGKYCGSSCEKWVRQQQQQPHQRQQHYPPSGVKPHSLVPSSGNVNWSTAATAGGETSNPQANIQHLSPGHPPVGGLVRCQKCGTTYSVRGRSRPRYETEPGNPIGHMSLPPCPSCGYSRRT